MWQMTLKILLVRAQIIKCKIPLNQQIVENRIVNREPDKKQLLDPYSQAWQTWQRMGCLKTWPYNYKQVPSLRFPIAFRSVMVISAQQQFWEN